jgi:hypothetical protein
MNNDFMLDNGGLRPSRAAVRRCVFIALLALACEIPAYANQPPGPGVALPAVLMLPMMALLTALGGGYAILRNPSKGSLLRRFLLGLVLFLLAAMHEVFGLLVTVLLCIIALERAVRLFVWGVKASASGTAPFKLGSGSDTTPTTPSEATVSSWRLVSAGIAIAVIAVFLTGSAFAFIGYWPGIQEHFQVLTLRRFLAEEIAYGRAQLKQFGQTRFRAIGDGKESDNWGERLARDKNVRIEFSPDRSHFTVLLLPSSRFPFWPYSLFTTQGSYRADEIGQIRMIRVHREDEVCPPDAPVIRQVTENEVVEDY